MAWSGSRNRSQKFEESAQLENEKVRTGNRKKSEHLGQDGTEFVLTARVAKQKNVKMGNVRMEFVLTLSVAKQENVRTEFVLTI